MARARNIKPGFFKNEVLAELPVEVRLLFIGLWTLADREGRLEDRPKKIKIEILVYDDVNVDELLEILATNDFIVRYKVDDKKYIQIKNFTKHQTPHHKEVASEIPAPPGMKQITKHQYDVSEELRRAVFARDGFVCLRCGSLDNLSIDHIRPLVNGGDNSINNLQTLCKSCNSIKGTTITDYRKVNVAPTLNQHRVDHGASCPPDSLIPDSLIPDSKPSTLVERGSKLLNEVSANEKIEKPDANASLSRERIHSSFPDKSSQKRIDQPFQPTEAAVRLAQKHGLDVGNEADLFVAHYEATGECRADWQACFRKWLLRAGQRKAETEKHAQGPPSKKGNYQKFNALDAINGGDGYGNKREPEHGGRIIDVGGGVAEEGQSIQRLITD